MRPTVRRGAALFALLTIVGAAPALADQAKPASPATVLDSAATRYDPARLGRSRVTLDLAFPERKENASLEAGATTLFGRDTRAERPDVTLTGPRRLILGLLFLNTPLAQLEAAGLKVEGDRSAVETLAGALDPIPGPFKIVEP